VRVLSWLPGRLLDCLLDLADPLQRLFRLHHWHYHGHLDGWGCCACPRRRDYAPRRQPILPRTCHARHPVRNMRAVRAARRAA
jgi:hypothetical protein